MHWIHGGETALGNLILLCYWHHRKIHEAGWQIVMRDDGHVMTIAPSLNFVRPRAPD